MHAVMNRAESLALVVDAMTNFMIFETIRTGPLRLGLGHPLQGRCLRPHGCVMWIR